MNLFKRLTSALIPDHRRSVVKENDRVQVAVRNLRQSTEEAIEIIESREPSGVWHQDMMQGTYRGIGAQERTR